MAVAHVAVRFEHRSGKKEDEVLNTFSFQTSGSVLTFNDCTPIALALADFYRTEDASSNHTLAQYMGPTVQRGEALAHMDFYDVTDKLSGASHGSPIRIHDWTLSAINPGATGLPNELAACLSYHAATAGVPEEAGTTRPAARRRGRVYLGPLNNITREDDPLTGRTRLTSQFMDTIAGAAQRLKDDPDTTWVVWSRSNADVRPVIAGHVDDAFDIQRRRGEDASLRVVWGS